MKALKKIQNEIENDSITHAYLLIGASDSEKESIIQGIVDKKRCLSADIVTVAVEEEAGKKSELKIEQIHQFLHQINLSSHGPCRLGVIYDADRLNITSGNALLKVLEEPAKNVILILIAKTEQVMTTIKSRCRTYRFATALSENHTKSYDEIISNHLWQNFKKVEQIVQEGRVEEFINDLILSMRDEMLVKKSSKIAKLIRLAQETLQRIRGNANSKLALENLILEITNYE
ncbi:MAG: hypothetical protein NTW50_03820 [Candidatus Berkelbacteria bacterium]|nr:hypothetical protein [Candidatus Berkelbacteria bacterium]